MKRSLALVSLVSVLAACGRSGSPQDENSANPQGPSAESALLLEDDEEVAASATEMLSEASDSAEVANADDQLESSDDQVSMGLAGAGGHKLGSYSRVCEEVDATAKVSISRERQASRFAFGNKKAGRISNSISESLSRTWSKENGEVDCNADIQRANIDPKNMDGLKLVVEFSRERKLVAKGTSKDRAEPAVSKGEKVASGVRTVEFSQDPIAQGATEFVRENSISIQAERNFSLVNGKGEEKSLQSKVSTSEPLKVKALLDASTLEIKERTLESGKLVNVGVKGRTITTEYKSVRFVKGDGCFGPVSGSIQGLVQKEGQEDKVFSIEFLSAGKAVYKVTGKEDKEISTACAE